MNQSNFFIVYFPYLSMRGIKEIDFSFAKIWNFSIKKNEYIQNQNIKEKIEKIFSCYESNGRSIIDEIGVFSIDEINFRHFDEDDLLKLKQTKLILFLSFLSKNNTATPNCNTGHDMATAENFDPIFQNFTLNNNYVSEKSGVIISFKMSGYKLDEVKYNRPSYVPKPRFSIDVDLMKQLIVLRNKKPLVFLRIMDAAEIFFQSYYNTHSVSMNARILLQMSAFEILLKIPDNQQRKYFREKIKELTVHKEDNLQAYNIKGRNGVVARGRFSMKEIWADKLYMLRNSIIHGDKLDVDDFMFNGSQLHTDIALLFFILTIKKQIEKSLRNKDFICNYEINWASWKDRTSQEQEITKHGFVYNFSNRKLFENFLAKHSK